MDDCFGKIITLLRDRQDFVVATIVSKSGSAPRVIGTKMIIRRDFTLIGCQSLNQMRKKVSKLPISTDNTAPVFNQIRYLASLSFSRISILTSNDKGIMQP